MIEKCLTAYNGNPSSSLLTTASSAQKSIRCDPSTQSFVPWYEKFMLGATVGSNGSKLNSIGCLGLRTTLHRRARFFSLRIPIALATVESCAARYQ